MDEMSLSPIWAEEPERQEVGFRSLRARAEVVEEHNTTKTCFNTGRNRNLHERGFCPSTVEQATCVSKNKHLLGTPEHGSCPFSFP